MRPSIFGPVRVQCVHNVLRIHAYVKFCNSAHVSMMHVKSSNALADAETAAHTQQTLQHSVLSSTSRCVFAERIYSGHSIRPDSHWTVVMRTNAHLSM